MIGDCFKWHEIGTTRFYLYDTETCEFILIYSAISLFDVEIDGSPEICAVEQFWQFVSINEQTMNQMNQERILRAFSDHIDSVCQLTFARLRLRGPDGGYSQDDKPKIINQFWWVPVHRMPTGEFYYKFKKGRIPDWWELVMLKHMDAPYYLHQW